ncbi:MAG: type III secretion system chaperone [Rhodocyclaceae bacterium]|nr:type III secretion system chaperone [Rhodocyclaceae bacterium]
MDTREHADALVRALGDTLQLKLALDAGGACGLRIDDRLELTLRLENHPPALLAYAQIGALPAGGADGVLRRLLAANHIWEGSQGATWSLHDDQLALARLLPLAGLDAGQLARELARFADVARTEQDRLQRPGGALSPEAGRPPFGMMTA